MGSREGRPQSQSPVLGGLCCVRLLQASTSTLSRQSAQIFSCARLNSHKRKTLLRLALTQVEACKGVHKVIKNSPCFGITKEFVEEHMLHVVCHGMEYTALEEAGALRVKVCFAPCCVNGAKIRW